MNVGKAKVGVVCALSAALVGLAAGPARGDGVTFEVPRQGPLPERARSLVISDSTGISIMEQPAMTAGLRGRTLPGASLRVEEARRGPGCRRLWLRVGPDAWICGDYGELSTEAPAPQVGDVVPAGELLPWPYAFTSRNGVRAYRTYSAALNDTAGPDDYEVWESNWGFAVRDTLGGAAGRVLRTSAGLFVRRSDVYRATPSSFAGGTFAELLGDDPGVPFGWVAGYGARVFPQPGEARGGEPIARLTRVRVYATQDVAGHAWARIGEGRWVRADRIRQLSPEAPPEEVNVAAHERWIDVDLTTQTLTAYEGAEPVYATLVSTGRGRFATPPGVFRIHSRYLSHTMDNTEATNLPNHFRLGDVPYVQFFDGDRGLHAVYWHDGFGVARSHGCVNLAPGDARYLFGFTSHPLPPGWATLALPQGQGTVVRVRGHFGE